MPLSGDPTILVPVDVSGGEPPEGGILELLRPVDVVVLGYYPVPDQTAPAQLRADHGSEATARLEEVVARFEGADHDVEGVLVFTPDREETIDRVAAEHDCDAVLLPGEGVPGAGSVERILVPLRGDANLERIVSLVGHLAAAGRASVTLFHSVAEEADRSRGEFLLRGAADRLVEDGVGRERVAWELAEGGDAAAEVVALAADHDLVVLGETEPSLRERIIGTVLTPILDRIEAPAIVVRDVD